MDDGTRALLEPQTYQNVIGLFSAAIAITGFAVWGVASHLKSKRDQKEQEGKRSLLDEDFGRIPLQYRADVGKLLRDIQEENPAKSGYRIDDNIDYLLTKHLL